MLKSQWCVFVGLCFLAGELKADDWPMLGRDSTRNAVSREKNPPLDWRVGLPARPASKRQPAREAITAANIRWSAELGMNCQCAPVVYRGTVWIGTTSLTQANQNKPGGALRCFRESDGVLLFERTSQPLPLRVNDAGWLGIGSSPLIENETLWYATNRWEVVCLDIGPLLASGAPPRERWVLDMPKEFGVFPHSPLMGPARHCSIAAYGERIFVTTGNGVDVGSTKVPAPDAPALVCLDKNTGKTLWTDKSPGGNVMYTEAANPLVMEIAGRPQVIVPQGDGWLRSFDPTSGKLLWQFDLNRKDTLHELGGRGTRNYTLSAPVFHEGRVYVTTGQDAEKGEGPGRLYCIDPTKNGDISVELAVDRDGLPLPVRRIQAVVAKDGERAIPNPNSGLIWEFDTSKPKFEEQMHRSVSSVVIADGLVVTADFAGLLHCLDAKTGQWHWSYDQLAACWGTPVIVDGHIYSVEEDGDVAILRLSADPKMAMPDGMPLAEINMQESVAASPVYANGTLYVATRNHLYAIEQPRMPRAPRALFVPTPPEVIARMLEVAEVTKSDTVVDLGSGDGRILIAAAKARGAKAIGYEIDRQLVERSREKVNEAGVEKLVEIHEQDFYKADLREATVVTAFLYGAVLQKLEPQFAKLKPGSRIVTHTFAIPGLTAERVETYKSTETRETYLIYLYKWFPSAGQQPTK